MEMRGIEPLASTMLKSHSTTEPHPLPQFINVNSSVILKIKIKPLTGGYVTRKRAIELESGEITMTRPT